MIIHDGRVRRILQICWFIGKENNKVVLEDLVETSFEILDMDFLFGDPFLLFNTFKLNKLKIETDGGCDDAHLERDTVNIILKRYCIDNLLHLLMRIQLNYLYLLTEKNVLRYNHYAVEELIILIDLLNTPYQWNKVLYIETS